jgi:Arc/MetJ-type ribon-helix-helix transcriptional regulator
MEQDPKATIKIPRALYRRLQTIVDHSGFDSVTDFIVYVLRDLVSTSATAHRTEAKEHEEPFTPEELEQVTERLKALGYL